MVVRFTEQSPCRYEPALKFATDQLHRLCGAPQWRTGLANRAAARPKKGHGVLWFACQSILPDKNVKT
jgi:hypothetical protein